jgi:hypothetical protein
MSSLYVYGCGTLEMVEVTLRRGRRKKENNGGGEPNPIPHTYRWKPLYNSYILANT